MKGHNSSILASVLQYPKACRGKGVRIVTERDRIRLTAMVACAG